MKVSRLCGLLALALVSACGDDVSREVGADGAGLRAGARRIPNGRLFENPGGSAASYSTQGGIALDGAFFEPQGTNGRSCATCHVIEDGWSIRASTVQRRFDETDGLDPLFANRIDADRPDAPVDTVDERRAAFTMLLQGKFSRRVNVAATAEWELSEFEDPFGQTTPTQLWFFRRPLPTANLLSPTVMWDGANTVGTDLRAGLDRQARGNVTGAQQGAPASDAVIEELVDFETALFVAQASVPNVGQLDAAGARGGPKYLAAQPLVSGPFDLYDAWAGSSRPLRAQIARGQALFNAINPGSGTSCQSCHDAANDGQNVNGDFFDVGASDFDVARGDMAVFTLRNKQTGATKTSTDPGRALRTGRWADVNLFKTPSLRGLSARGHFFHNGITDTLSGVVRHYERKLGFVYTAEERADLVAFLNAL